MFMAQGFLVLEDVQEAGLLLWFEDGRWLRNFGCSFGGNTKPAADKAMASLNRPGQKEHTLNHAKPQFPHPKYEIAK